MSDLPADYREQLDLRSVIARIDRDRAETLKLQGESEKFVAEQRKLIAEAKKLGRDPWVILIGGLLAIIAGITARLPEIMKAFGWLT